MPNPNKTLVLHGRTLVQLKSNCYQHSIAPNRLNVKSLNITAQPPDCIATLDRRAQALQGFSLGELAASIAMPVPGDLKSAKGWVGQLIEALLGADSGSLPQPDFPKLGIELKTLPIDPAGRPLESTFVCTAPRFEVLDWEHSLVYQKLQHVLWMPIVVASGSHVGERTVGQPFRWQPSIAQAATLQQDWLELSELLYCGEQECLSAKLGTSLQLRPKAAHSRVATPAFNQAGLCVPFVPKGYYLRSRFTATLMP